ncbi:hypothetical protein GCM10025857_17780 [Alicyclobacillus contaminans]|nr:hypothetical protein GCM10025857_17780 [Alicyclobacillus contaminans]
MNRMEVRGTLRWFVGLSLVVLAIGFLSGLTHPSTYAHSVEDSLDQLRQLAQQTGAATLRTLVVIFVHNLLAAALFLFSGVLFGVIPITLLWYNGVLMGYVCAIGAGKLHVSSAKLFLYALLPHGLFELSALVWACGLGVNLGFSGLFSLIRWLQAAGVESRDDRTVLEVRTLRGTFRQVWRHAPWIVALLLVAAVIESYVTPEIMQWGISTGRAA